MNIPSLHGNWVDLVILIVLFLYLLSRSRRGFIEGVFDLGGFLLSLVFGLRFYSLFAQFFIANFSLPYGIANTLGFLATVFIGEFLFYLLEIYLLGLLDKPILQSKLNTRTGIIPAILSFLILAAFVLTSFLSLPVRPDIKNDIVHSRIGGFLAQKTLGLEQKLSEIFGGAVQDTLTFLTVKPQGKDNVDLHFKTSDFNADEPSEATMFTLVNQERMKNGLLLLAEDEALKAVARAHCSDMFKRGYFSHYTPETLSPFDRMNSAGIRYHAAGENLAYAPNIDIAHTGLMNSPGHRANILSVEYRKVGIGVISAGVYGRMFCQEFTD